MKYIFVLSLASATVSSLACASDLDLNFINSHSQHNGAMKSSTMASIAIKDAVYNNLDSLVQVIHNEKISTGDLFASIDDVNIEEVNRKKTINAANVISYSGTTSARSANSIPKSKATGSDSKGSAPYACRCKNHHKAHW